jgi:hypothetical protein
MACFLDSVAGSSRLRRLKVDFVKWSVAGEKFITGILAKHSDTLSVLCLPPFRSPEGIYTQIFSCPKLKKLSIGLTSLLMVRSL